MNIAIFGMGEAGSLIAGDLAAAGITVTAYDPANIPNPEGITRTPTPAEATIGADMVFSITAGHDSYKAIQQALAEIPVDSVYADFSTSSAEVKKRLALVAADRGFKFVDIALMGTVPGKGIKTPMLASGTAAEQIHEFLSSLGAPIEVVSDQAGDAATRKLLRSIMMKGLAACSIEALRAAEKANCVEWLWQNISDEIKNADASLVRRLVSGTQTHAVRRLHEMDAALALLKELRVESLMTEATAENLRRIPAQGVPDVPGNASEK